jgi:hypothetical protein
MNIKTTYGVHILLNFYHILSSIRETNEEPINLQIDFDSFRNNRNDVNSNYSNKYKELIHEILKIDNLNINYGNDYPFVDWSNGHMPFDKDFIKLKSDNHFTKYFLPEIDISKPFICVNTKIVNSSIEFNSSKNPDYNFIDKYNNIKDDFFKILNDSNLNVVILGEKNIPDCNEYNFHRDNFGNFIMYDDFKKNIKNLIDETYEDSKDGYDLYNWKKTCYYLTHSKMNIFIGNGGGVHLYSNFKNTLQFGVKDRLLSWVNEDLIETGFMSVNNNNEFLNTIKNKLIQ